MAHYSKYIFCVILGDHFSVMQRKDSITKQPLPETPITTTSRTQEPAGNKHCTQCIYFPIKFPFFFKLFVVVIVLDITLSPEENVGVNVDMVEVTPAQPITGAVTEQRQHHHHSRYSSGHHHVKPGIVHLIFFVQASIATSWFKDRGPD